MRLVAVAVGAEQCVQCGEALHAAEHAARALAQQRRHLDPRGVLCGAALLLSFVLGLHALDGAVVRLRLGVGLDGLRGEARRRVLEEPTRRDETATAEAVEAET